MLLASDVTTEAMDESAATLVATAATAMSAPVICQCVILLLFRLNEFDQLSIIFNPNLPARSGGPHALTFPRRFY